MKLAKSLKTEAQDNALSSCPKLGPSNSPTEVIKNIIKVEFELSSALFSYS